MRALLALTILLAAALPLTIVGAQEGITVTSATARNQFPDGAVFSLAAESDAEITSVVFRYTIPPEGANVYGDPECSEGARVECSFNLKSTAKLFLVPGANIIYYWEIKDKAGNELKTEPQTFIYEDDRFEWKSRTQDDLVIWYYSAGESELRDLLDIGVEGLRRMESLLGASLDFPVKVFLYDSAEDMQAAAYGGKTGQRGVITLGEVFFSDTAIVSADIFPHDVLRHELAHIVMRQALKGPFGNAPAWLDEGTAVYAQSQPLSGEESVLQSAIRGDRVFSLRTMTSGSLARNESDVSLFYAQSWSVVSYLIETHGEEKFADLLATLREGNAIDEALESVYGFDQDGLDNAWRESVGLSPRTSEGGAGKATGIPQLTPYGAGGPQGAPTRTPTPEAKSGPADDDGSGFPLALAGIVAAAVVAGGGLLAGGVLLVRRR